MTARPIEDPAVAAAFDARPPTVRRALLRLRDLILDAAEATPGTGTVMETLKWRQPTYGPARPRVGTTVRIDGIKGRDDAIGMYFHCQTTLVSTIRELYPELGDSQGNRAIVFSLGRELPEDTIRHCVAQALTYHLK
jgi:hypothetical protein